MQRLRNLSMAIVPYAAISLVFALVWQGSLVNVRVSYFNTMAVITILPAIAMASFLSSVILQSNKVTLRVCLPTGITLGLFVIWFVRSAVGPSRLEGMVTNSIDQGSAQFATLFMGGLYGLLLGIALWFFCHRTLSKI